MAEDERAQPEGDEGHHDAHARADAEQARQAAQHADVRARRPVSMTLLGPGVIAATTAKTRNA